MKAKKISERKIRKVDEVIRNLPALPQTFTYVRLYQVLLELHFQGKYKCVSKLCDAVLEEYKSAI